MNIRYPIYEGVYRILTFLRTHRDELNRMLNALPRIDL